ncbi:MAG: hypothetical protein IJF12_04370 [Alphaproteobacteria bacterium]|nr:hypothetical protein [Alphaproteobacteria bacterium]
MELKNLPQSEKALNELESLLQQLQETLQGKKNALLQQRQSYKHNMAEKTKQIDDLKQTVADTLSKVTGVAQKIDMVLKEDGSSNNNN